VVFYEAMIYTCGARPVRVRLQPSAFALDITAIVAAFGPRTRAVIFNTPHNPTGRIYSAAALEPLAKGLAKTGEHYGRPIWLISDERTAAFSSTITASPVPVCTSANPTAVPHTARSRG
jgi:aspartate/methionine/tyrosine aminotransferase